MDGSIFKDLHGDLIEFVDRISSVLRCPITLEDANHRLLAYSIHDDFSDPVRISTIISRRVPEKVINNLWKQGIIPALLKDDSPIIIPSINELAFGKRAAVSIRKNQEVLGFIWALETSHPFTENDLHFLKIAAQEGKNQLLLVKNNKPRHQKNNQEFLWKLIMGHFETEDELKIICSEQAIPTPASFSIVIFSFATPIHTSIERHIAYTLSTTQKIRALFYTIDKQRLIIVAERVETGDFISALSQFINTFISQMEIRFHIQPIHGACGQIYDSYLQAKNSYQEALYILQLQQAFPTEQDRLINYSEIGIFQYLSYLHQSQVTTIYQQKLQQLMNYDQNHQTQFAHTLQTFLQYDSNPSDTAKVIHIHVNSVHYRLKRASEIINLNLKDPYEKMALHLEFLLNQYKNFLNTKNSDTLH